MILGELGRVCLARDRPAEALTVWIDGGHWEEAAYVAERVLSLEELRAWVDDSVGAKAAEGDERAVEAARLWSAVRHLLARRLMRADRADEALAYFTEDVRKSAASYAASYAADVRAGFALERADAERAAAFWRAARMLRAEGMELLGTELEPDSAAWGGSFEMLSVAEARREEGAKSGGAFAPTKDELRRVADHAVPQKRFHYRYRAAQLAWWAASLTPNDAEETARVLVEAGGWLKARDPEAARAFYQALVIRCAGGLNSGAQLRRGAGFRSGWRRATREVASRARDAFFARSSP